MKKTANEIKTGNKLVDYYLSNGFTLREIEAFLCDGEALAIEGIEDQNAVEAADDLVKELSQHE